MTPDENTVPPADHPEGTTPAVPAAAPLSTRDMVNVLQDHHERLARLEADHHRIAGIVDDAVRRVETFARGEGAKFLSMFGIRL